MPQFLICRVDFTTPLGGKTAMVVLRADSSAGYPLSRALALVENEFGNPSDPLALNINCVSISDSPDTYVLVEERLPDARPGGAHEDDGSVDLPLQAHETAHRAV